MKYLKFIIKGYRGISEETEINIEKESLIPIIGKNESGKTTCLEAIHAFDYSNDSENGGKHLNNIDNLYSTVETSVVVAAVVEVDESFDLKSDFQTHFDEAKTEYATRMPQEEFNELTVNKNLISATTVPYISAFQLLHSELQNNNSLTIDRDLRTKKYSLPLLGNSLPLEFVDTLCRRIIKACPYILYFDDFRDRMPDQVFISDDKENALYSPWIEFLDELFNQTKKEYSVYELPSKKDSIRRSIITEVQKYLNKKLIAEWSKYQFENAETIELKIDYTTVGETSFLQFKIIERVLIDNSLEERYFDISDRSKGFYWYFNFMIKLHFNPKKRDTNDIDTIYLLDEPGSYLHTYALNKLVEQLRNLSKQNKVIYCTHFHNLLNPEFVPINSIRIAEKLHLGKIRLSRLDDAQLIRPKRNSAYQPVLDALEVKPPLVEYDFDKVILVEGIYDYYSFKMFTVEEMYFFPCVGASSIVNQIPYMIFLGKKYLAMWDDDMEGRGRLQSASELFGEFEAKKFLLLSSISNQASTRMEEYYDSTESQNYMTEQMGVTKLSLNKVILHLFFSTERQTLIDKYFPKTKSNFLTMQNTLLEKLKEQT